MLNKHTCFMLPLTFSTGNHKVINILGYIAQTIFSPIWKHCALKFKRISSFSFTPSIHFKREVLRENFGRFDVVIFLVLWVDILILNLTFIDEENCVSHL